MLALSIAVVACVFSMGGAAAPFTEVAPEIFLFSDACNVYCIRSGDEAVLIECGTGAVKAHLSVLAVERVPWILHTHAHRDLSQGDTLFCREAAQVAVPKGAETHFAEAEKGWYDRPTYYAFAYGPKFFLPLRDIPVARTLSHGDVFEWRDVRLDVVHTPGHTETHVSFILERDGKRYGFTGDVICSPGKLWELDSLQSSYEEFIQAKNAVHRVPELLRSIETLRKLDLDMILPAHGDPFGDCDAALGELAVNVRRMMVILENTKYFSGPPVDLPEIAVCPTGAAQYLIEADNGHGILCDAGFVTFGNSPVNLIEWLRNRTSLYKIDIITASHYHCDHMAAVRGISAHYGADVYVHESLRDIFEEPHRFFAPCLHMYPTKVVRSFTDGESFEWNGHTFTFYHFPGQTYWHQAMLADIKGEKILFTGDSIDDFTHIRCIDCFNYCPISETDGGMKCIRVLEETQPDYIATGHWGIHRWRPEYIDGMRRFMEQRNAILTALIGQEEPNFGYDVHWARLDPFRTVVEGNHIFALTARVRNHFASDKKVALRLTLPKGWSAEPEVVEDAVPGKGEGAFEFRVAVPDTARNTRHIVGLDTTLGAQPFGEMGMAVVDVGGNHDVERRNPGLFPGVSDKDYAFF
ncbi:MAG TPA: MBL fold metallo-hydrolase [Candidatus Hydrogenedentes bacterium]|nr:MBL fold metallo-hydrolase [Candidatus Hydrogenedentota bacterium]